MSGGALPLTMDEKSSGSQESSTPGNDIKHQNDMNSHKRTPSGGPSKLAILRASAEDNEIQADTPLSPEDKPKDSCLNSKKGGRAMAVAVAQQKTRRRKGSLRKAALLGRSTQRNSLELGTSPLNLSAFGADGNISPISPDDTSFHGTTLSPARPTSNHMGHYPGDAIEAQTFSSLPGPILSPKPLNPAKQHPGALKPSPPLSYTSTTDEDDVLSFPRSAATAASSTSYFDSTFPFRRASPAKSPSPLSHSLTMPPSPNTWDYTTTAQWGWVILFVTWLVFVVGMGSCFGVWSWAWDVGETPYAPPELEDDPTLPIVGYYPALIILSAVMAWVWVVVAWVGMKYFRHARISGD